MLWSCFLQENCNGEKIIISILNLFNMAAVTENVAAAFLLSVRLIRCSINRKPSLKFEKVKSATPVGVPDRFISI